MSQRKHGQNLPGRELDCGRQEEHVCLRTCRQCAVVGWGRGEGDETAKVDRRQVMKLDDISQGLDSPVC